MVYRVGGACFTYTEFARVLHEMLEDRKFAISSGCAESYRSEGRRVASNVALKNSGETETMKLRAQATLLEDSSRYLIALPSLQAAKVELHLIEKLLTAVMQKVTDDIPYAFHACQKNENTLGLQWRGFIETLTYQTVSADTLSELFARGLPRPDYTDVADRSQFLEKFNTSRYASLAPSDLDDLYGCALADLQESPLLLDYKNALTLGSQNAPILGIGNDSPRILQPVAEIAGRSCNAQGDSER